MSTRPKPYYADELAGVDLAGLEAAREHPDDRRAYYVFAELMGWKADWEDLGSARDVPGPGRLPFVAAFRYVRESLREGGTRVPPSRRRRPLGGMA